MKKRSRRSGPRPSKPVSNAAGETGRRPRYSREVAILYEDDSVVVLNKPAGLPAVPIPGSDKPSALSLLTARLQPIRQRALVVHRIDRFTSGILLFATNRRDREPLVQQFLEHAPVREYLAVIRGELERPEGTLVHYFRKAGMFQQICNRQASGAARAELFYSVERRLQDASLVRVALVTGLQNQIRAQFAEIGHPVLGDRKYHPAEAETGMIDRVALHATRLEFTHPRTGEPVAIDCPPPADFQHLVQKLARSHARH